MDANKYLKPRFEEIIVGGLLGAAVGLALTLPFVAPLATLNPLSLAAGFADTTKAAIADSAMLVCAIYGAWLLARQERDSHLRGARFLPTPSEARTALQAQENVQFSEAQRKHEVRGIEIGGIELARSREVGHFYAVGLPGAGKTVLLTSAIDQALARGDRLIVHDPKGDFVARYYGVVNMVLLGPWDDRAATWDASADIDTPALANEFASAVVSGGLPISSQTGNSKHFIDGASRLLAGLIRSYQAQGQPWRWSDLKNAVAGDDPVALVRRAARGDSALKLTFPTVFPSDPQAIPTLDKDGPAILSTLGNAGGWLVDFGAVDEARPDAPKFSLRRWLLHEAHDEVRVVVLNSNSLYPRAAENLFSAMLATVAATLASPRMPEIDADAQGTWIILDEFPQLGATSLAKIQQIAELGRSRGVRMVTALQDETQLIAKAGRDQAEPMLAVQSTRIYMRSSDKTAEAVSRRIGNCDVHRIETTSDTGAIQGKTKRVHTKQVILPSELLGLKVRTQEPPLGVELVLHIEGTLGRLIQPFPERRKPVAAAFVECEPWKRGSLPPGPDGEGGADAGRGEVIPPTAPDGADPAGTAPIAPHVDYRSF